MKRFSQAYWDEPLLKDLGRPGRVGMRVPTDPAIASRFRDPSSLVPAPSEGPPSTSPSSPNCRC